MMQKPAILAAALCLALAACAEDDTTDNTTEVCPAIEGDHHVAAGKSEPDNLAMMLHVAGRECSKTGANTFVVYPMKESMAPFAAAGMMGTGTVTIESVEATMPAMGHGTAEPAKIMSDNTFNVAFQMPGEWVVEVVFSSSTTDASQTVEFPITVQ